MNPPKCDDNDYIDFLIASQKSFACTEAARCQPDDDAGVTPPAHDSFTRLLERLPADTEALWDEAKRIIAVTAGGVLIVDDSTLDKPYAEKMDYVTYHWSGKHHSVVKGINLITTLWSDGNALIPCDFRLYNASKDGLTKNDHFQDMLLVAKQRGMEPKYVLFDSGYSSMENLKLIARESGGISSAASRRTGSSIQRAEKKETNQSRTWRSRLREPRFISWDSEWSGCSGQPPRKETLNTGLPMTLG